MTQHPVVGEPIHNLPLHCAQTQNNIHDLPCLYNGAIVLKTIFKSIAIFRKLKLLVKGKAVPLEASGGPEGSRKLRLPDYMTTTQDSGKVVSLKHRPPLLPGNAPGTHFC